MVKWEIKSSRAAQLSQDLGEKRAGGDRVGQKVDYAMAWLSFDAIKKTTVQGLSCNNYPSHTAIQRAYPSQQSALRDHFTLAIFRNVKSRLTLCVVKDTMLYEI